MGVTILTDSASSLAQDDIARFGIDVIPLRMVENGVSTPDTEVDLHAFYRRLPTLRPVPTTSAPSPAEFAEAFAREVERGEDVVAVLISSKLSSTFEAAESGAAMVREQHPNARIELIDSESNSMQEGFAVLAAAECEQAGGSFDECAAAARATLPRTRFLFAPASLDYLARGGRISGARRLLGSMLKITPILTAVDGNTAVAGTVRTYKRALSRIAEFMRADVQRCGIRRAFVQPVVDHEGAARFARELIEPIVGFQVPVVDVPLVVGIHVGPAIGVAYETVEPLR
ncbi:MAG: DegV family protein [Coriobacteriia bacterium]|nr:DegV family protein [Coriobacteriia bacterium]